MTDQPPSSAFCECGNYVAPHPFPGCPTAPAPPPALRDRYAAAIYEYNNPGMRWADAHPDDLICYGGDADAVLAIRDQEMEQLRAETNAWRRKAIRRAIRLGRHESTLQAIREYATEEVTQQDGWGDGYRQALADLAEILDTLMPQEQP